VSMDAALLAQLYQDVIVDHNRSPRNFRRLEPCTVESGCHRATGDNPLCGDRLHLYVDVADDAIRDVAFQGSGCAISVASASLMTEAVKGKRLDETRGLFDTMHGLLTGTVVSGAEDLEGLGKLAALAGVSAYPMRVKCATLCWHTLQAALDDRDNASTE